MNSPDDSNHGIDSRYVRVALNLSHLQKVNYTSRLSKVGLLPRLLWLDKNWTLKQAHHYVFNFIKEVIGEWIDWKDPKTEKKPKSNSSVDLRTSDLIEFPFRPLDWPKNQAFTKKDFNEMDSEAAFNMTFPELVSDSPSNDDTFQINEKPYNLIFKNISGTWGVCDYCGQTKCSGCSVPYSEDKLEKVFEQIKQDSVNSFYSRDHKSRGKEMILQIVWHQDIHQSLFSFLATAIKFEVDENLGKHESADIQLTDCLREFKSTETLDEDNKWYCSKCKDHVQATKTLEIFRVPRILVISLKRFKTSRSKYGGMGMGG